MKRQSSVMRNVWPQLSADMRMKARVHLMKRIMHTSFSAHGKMMEQFADEMRKAAKAMGRYNQYISK